MQIVGYVDSENASVLCSWCAAGQETTLESAGYVPVYDFQSAADQSHTCDSAKCGHMAIGDSIW